MKHSNRLLIVVIILTTSLICYLLPLFVHKATVSASKYPFMYYSSRLREIALIDYSDKANPMMDINGNVYSAAQFDSLMPLLNYRQLLSSGTLPDSLDGHEITPRILMVNSVVYRFEPKDIATSVVDIYAMLETMPQRGGLSVPNDFFRIKNRIEFIDAATNTVDRVKSDNFAKQMAKQGYEFPTQWAAGDASTRKSYDEGYFCLDNRGELFHIKMVNGRPYVRNTKASDQIDIAYFSPLPVATKRFYGFMASRGGEFYILESDNEGGYLPRKLDIEPIDLKSDRLMVMGNLLYWNVAVTSNEGKRLEVLRSDDLSRVATHFVASSESLWDRLSQWILPIRLTLESSNSSYIYPRVHFGAMSSWILSALLAIVAAVVLYRKSRFATKLIVAAITVVGGVAALIALCILPKIK